MDAGHPLRAADAIAFDKSGDDLGAAVQTETVHLVFPRLCKHGALDRSFMQA
jgi:hypothetical protein